MTGALGKFGESWAVGRLQHLGYRIVDRNVRFRTGELDIVAYDGTDLVFVEVKCRRAGMFGTPEESISPRRFEHLATAATEYLVRNGLQGCNVRLDLMAIEVGAGGRVTRHNLIRGIESPRRT